MTMGRAKKQTAAVEKNVSEENVSSQFIGSFLVPFGYELWQNGVYISSKEDEPSDLSPDAESTASTITPGDRLNHRGSGSCVLRAPVWPSKIGTSIDTNEQIVEISYRDSISGQILTEWVPRLHLASRAKCVGLSRLGIPVTDENVSEVLNYFDRALALNANRIPFELMAARSGAYKIESSGGGVGGGKSIGWLVGEHWIGPEGTSVKFDPTRAPRRGFGCRGDRQEWFRKWREIGAKSGVLRWLNYSSLAPPLLRLTETRTFFVHQFGQSGGGKTASAKLAISAWGDVDDLAMSFNRTEISFIEIFRGLDDLPVFFDELQVSTISASKLIYAVCGEKGRGRALREGGVQKETPSWRTIVRTTGEEPLVGMDTPDLGGQRNRVVQIPTYDLLSSPEAAELHAWIAQKHYGWGGFEFLHRLADLMSENPEFLGELHRDLHTRIFSQLPEYAYAQAAFLTVVALAQVLGENWFYGISLEDAIRVAVEDALEVAEVSGAHEKVESIVDKALDLVQDHYIAQRGLWLNLESRTHSDLLASGHFQRLFGVVTPVEIWLVQTEVNELLRRAKLPPKRVWTDLHRKGVLKAQGREFGCVRSFGKFRRKVYVLKRSECLTWSDVGEVADGVRDAGEESSLN